MAENALGRQSGGEPAQHANARAPGRVLSPEREDSVLHRLNRRVQTGMLGSGCGPRVLLVPSRCNG
jgi:hypothetical protein